MFNFYYSMGASFLGTFVEFVEAVTIILAVGVVRGWRSALLGTLTALVILGVLVGVVGAPLQHVIQLAWVQFIVGLCILLFGIRWLRKAILRYAGLKALHDETESYKEEVQRLRNAGSVTTMGVDKVAFATTLGITFLEGLEAIFIVLTIGFGTHSLHSAIIGALIATAVVIVIAVSLRKPLSMVPENTTKFVVGIMLTSFGTFWIGESLSVPWPNNDVSILYLAVAFLLYSWIHVVRCKRTAAKRTQDVRDSLGVNS